MYGNYTYCHSKMKTIKVAGSRSSIDTSSKSDIQQYNIPQTPMVCLKILFIYFYSLFFRFMVNRMIVLLRWVDLFFSRSIQISIYNYYFSLLFEKIQYHQKLKSHQWTLMEKSSTLKKFIGMNEMSSHVSLLITTWSWYNSGNVQSVDFVYWYVVLPLSPWLWL